MELVMIKGRLYWFTDFDGSSIDGIALSAFGLDFAFRKDDVYYIFEGLKEELVSSFEMHETEMVKHFFDKFPYTMDSCPTDYIHHKKVA